MDAGRWFFSKERIQRTPSRRDGVESSREVFYRQQAATLIQDMGQKLLVSQLCINSAIVYMHRFYMFHSFAKFHRNFMAPCCLFLACKVEEQPRKLEQLLRVGWSFINREAPPLDIKSGHFRQLYDELVRNENILLATLGFDCSIDHPHTHVVQCCQLIRASKDLAQTSYFMATNSLHLTTMCLQYRSTLVACVCIFLVYKWSGHEIPRSSQGREWYSYVDADVTLDQLERVSEEFLLIFNQCPSKLKTKIMNSSKAISDQESERRHRNEGTRSRAAPASSASSASASSAAAAATFAVAQVSAQSGSGPFPVTCAPGSFPAFSSSLPAAATTTAAAAGAAAAAVPSASSRPNSSASRAYRERKEREQQLALQSRERRHHGQETRESRPPVHTDQREVRPPAHEHREARSSGHAQEHRNSRVYGQEHSRELRPPAPPESRESRLSLQEYRDTRHVGQEHRDARASAHDQRPSVNHEHRDSNVLAGHQSLSAAAAASRTALSGASADDHQRRAIVQHQAESRLAATAAATGYDSLATAAAAAAAAVSASSRAPSVGDVRQLLRGVDARHSVLPAVAAGTAAGGGITDRLQRPVPAVAAALSDPAHNSTVPSARPAALRLSANGPHTMPAAAAAAHRRDLSSSRSSSAAAGSSSSSAISRHTAAAAAATVSVHPSQRHASASLPASHHQPSVLHQTARNHHTASSAINPTLDHSALAVPPALPSLSTADPSARVMDSIFGDTAPVPPLESFTMMSPLHSPPLILPEVCQDLAPLSPLAPLATVADSRARSSIFSPPATLGPAAPVRPPLTDSVAPLGQSHSVATAAAAAAVASGNVGAPSTLSFLQHTPSSAVAVASLHSASTSAAALQPSALTALVAAGDTATATVTTTAGSSERHKHRDKKKKHKEHKEHKAKKEHKKHREHRGHKKSRHGDESDEALSKSLRITISRDRLSAAAPGAAAGGGGGGGGEDQELRADPDGSCGAGLKIRIGKDKLLPLSAAVDTVLSAPATAPASPPQLHTESPSKKRSRDSTSASTSSLALDTSLHHQHHRHHSSKHKSKRKRRRQDSEMSDSLQF